MCVFRFQALVAHNIITPTHQNQHKGWLWLAFVAGIKLIAHCFAKCIGIQPFIHPFGTRFTVYTNTNEHKSHKFLLICIVKAFACVSTWQRMMLAAIRCQKGKKSKGNHFLRGGVQRERALFRCSCHVESCVTHLTPLQFQKLTPTGSANK